MRRLASGGVIPAIALLAVALLGACGNSSLKRIPPLPALADFEPGVAVKIRALHDAMAANPTAATWAAYARTLDAHGMNEATEAYLVAAEHAPMPEKFDLLYLAGRSCVKRDPERAIVLLEQANQSKGDYHPLHLRLAALYEKALRFEDSRREFARAQELKPSSVSLVGMGRLALIEGKVPEAIGLLERARDMAPDHAEAHATLAQAYARAGRMQDAARASALAGDVEREYGFVDPIANVMAREGVSFSSLEQFGVAALRGHEFEEALAALDRALAVRPDSLEILALRAQALVGLRRFAEAEPVLDRVLAAKPEDAQSLTFRAGCFMARNELPRAVGDLRKAVAVDPGLVHARWNLARALRGLNQNAEARQQLLVLLQQRPHKADARILLATILAESGNKAEAIAQLDAALSHEPSNQQALELKQRLTER